MVNKKKAPKIKVEYAQHTKTPELPPTRGIGPEVNYETLPEIRVESKKIDEKLLKAGVKEPFVPSTPLSKETVKRYSTTSRRINNKPNVFAVNAPVQKVSTMLSNSSTKRVQR